MRFLDIPNTTKATRIAVTFRNSGETVYWTARRTRIGFTTARDWTYTDHDGYERHGGHNWLDCVARVRATAENYGATANIS
jgi:hypothetical protein